MLHSVIEADHQFRLWTAHGDTLHGVSPGTPLAHDLVALLGSFARAASDPHAYDGAVQCPEMPVEFTVPTCDPSVVKTTGYAVHANAVPWSDFADVAGREGYVVGEHFLRPLDRVPEHWRRA